MSWNERLFIFINQSLQNPFFDWFFPLITDLHKMPWFPVVVLPIVLFFLVKKYRYYGLVYFFFLILTLAASDLTGAIVKRNFPQPRPFQVHELNPIQRSPASKNTSFYSNHASNNFAFAIFMALSLPSAWWLYYSIAMAVAFSRIYNGVHFPLDVLAGAAAGTVIGWVLYWICAKILQKWRFKIHNVS